MCRPELGGPNRREERKEGDSPNSSDGEVVACFSSLWAKVNLVNKVISSYKKQNENSLKALSRSLVKEHCGDKPNPKMYSSYD